MSSDSNSEQSEVLKNEGNNLFKQGKFKGAITKYTEAISLNPSNEKLFANRAFASQKLNKLHQALIDINKAIEINPKWYKSHARKGDILKLINKKHEAIKSYKFALKLTDNESMQNHIKKVIEELNFEYLSKEQIFKFMSNSIYIKSNDGMTEKERPDFIKRLNLFSIMIKNKKLQNIECKDLFGFENSSQILKMMHQQNFKCFGNNHVEFKKFNQNLSCSKYQETNQVQTRFNEWIQSGMCHLCQIKYFEQSNDSY